MFITSDLAKLIPLPDENANKYSRGKCALIAGSRRYPGAACLSACASQYAGAGYTEVFTAEGNELILQVRRPSLVVRGFGSCEPKKMIAADHPGAVVVGPGLDPEDTCARELCVRAIKKVKHPLLLDGGALSFVASDAGMKALRMRAVKQRASVLTPHVGEAARLARPLDLPLDDIYRAAARLARAYHSVVVLKGPETIVSDGQRSEVFAQGTPALAKAGTGDVLSGIIGGLLAQGVQPFEGAYLGVALHAKAGKIAAAELGEVSVCAEEVLEAIPQAIEELLAARR